MSKTNWESTLSDFRASGMSQASFAKSRGIDPSTLCQKLKTSSESGSFVRIETEKKIELEINGMKLRFQERLLPEVLKALQS